MRNSFSSSGGQAGEQTDTQAESRAGSAGAEFSHRIALAEISSRGLSLSLEANAQERQAVAERLRLVAVARLAGSFTLMREAAGVIRAEGKLEARCTQTCVVSLEPLTREVRKSLRVRFFPRAAAQEATPRGKTERGKTERGKTERGKTDTRSNAPRETETRAKAGTTGAKSSRASAVDSGYDLIADPFATDEEDALFYSGLSGPDLGEALVQELALSLDPYPRRENAALTQTTWGEEAGDDKGGDNKAGDKVGNEAGSEAADDTATGTGSKP